MRDRTVEIEALVEGVSPPGPRLISGLRRRALRGTVAPRSSHVRAGRLLDQAVRVIAFGPASTSARSTASLNTRPYDVSKLSRIPVGVHDEPFDDAGELPGHVIREDQRIGEDDALHRRVRHVALVPQRDILEPGLQVAPEHVQPAELLRAPRIALVRHALDPFCAPVANGSCTSPTSVRCRCRTSSAQKRPHRRAERRARIEELRVPVEPGQPAGAPPSPRGPRGPQWYRQPRWIAVLAAVVLVVAGVGTWIGLSGGSGAHSGQRRTSRCPVR